jgi:hypothetical protein
MSSDGYSDNVRGETSSEFDSTDTEPSDLMDSDDLGSDIEVESLKSAEYFASYLTRKRFFVAEKDPITGALIRKGLEKNGKPSKKRYLYLARLKKGNQHRMIRPEFCKNVLRKATIEDLLHKLRNTPGGFDREKLPFGNREIEFRVKLAFDPDCGNNRNMVGFMSEVVSLLRVDIPFHHNEYRIRPKIKYFDGCLALGLIPHLTKLGSESESGYIDLESGCIGFANTILRSSIEDKPFAVFEFNVFNNRLRNDLPWYIQRKPWVLELFNSFIGSDAEVGGALSPEGIFLMWREEVKEEGEGGEVLKTYNYYALNPTHLEPINPGNIEAISDFFVELVRICSKKENHRYRFQKSTEQSESEPEPVPETTNRTDQPADLPKKVIHRSLITQINSPEKLLVARVDLELEMGKEALHKMSLAHEQWAKKQRERTFSD